MTDRSPWRQLVDAITHAGPSYQPAIPPRRGDQVETWLKAHRDRREERDGVWRYLDEMLDDYRLHADTGTPLDQHVCEGGNPDDCAGCYDQQHLPIQSCHLDQVHDAHKWATANGNTFGCIGFPEVTQ